MVQYCITSYKGEFTKIPKSVRRFVKQRFEFYYEDERYGHDFIEELVNCDLIIKYSYDSFRIFVI